MNLVSKLMIAFGVLIILFALSMDISLEGADVVNIGLISERQNILILGSIVFLAGIVLYAVPRLGSNNDIDDSIQEKSNKVRQKLFFDLFNKPKEFLVSLWNGRDIGGRIIIVAAILATSSLGMNWKSWEFNISESLLGGGSGITMKNFIAVGIFWSYPIIMLIKNKEIVFKWGLLCSIFSILWMFREIFMIASFNKALDMPTLITSPGAGLWLSLIASVTLALGIFTSEWLQVSANQNDL